MPKKKKSSPFKGSPRKEKPKLRVKSISQNFILVPLAAATLFLLPSKPSKAQNPDKKSEDSSYSQIYEPKKIEIEHSVLDSAQILSKIDSIWIKMCNAFPEAIDVFQKKASSRLEPVKIPVEIVSNSRFLTIPDDGKSCRLSEDDIIYANKERPFNAYEFAFRAGYLVSRYAIIYKPTPFGNYAARRILPSLMASQIAKKEHKKLMHTPKEEAIAFFFAALCPPAKFADACASSDINLFKKEYEKAFGRGSYGWLMCSQNKFEKLQKMCKGNPEAQEILQNANQIAKESGFKPPFKVD